MSVVTDTTNHENGIGVVVLGWQTTRAWIPAYAGMTVWRWCRRAGLKPAPTECWLAGGYFLRNRSCRTTKHENGRAIRESPLREVGEGYFQGNDRRVCYPGERDSANRMKNCRLSGLAMASMLTA